MGNSANRGDLISSKLLCGLSCGGVSLKNRKEKGAFSLACDEVFPLEKDVKEALA
jgi:hypothetical protein